MLKVLIADDEIKVCQLIFHLINWESLGLEVIGIVNDGKSAYDLICEKSPDIVITDIRMPNYDGMELIQKSKELNPDIYFIIISGYSHFEYAQKAIKFGVEDYLLKPLKKKELENTLNKIIEKNNVVLSVNSDKEKLQTLVHTAQEKAKKNLLAEMLVNPEKIGSTLEMEAINKGYHCHFANGYFAVIKIQPHLAEELMDDSGFMLLLSKIQQITEEKLKPYCIEFITYIHDYHILCIINSSDPELTEIKKQLNRMRNDISKLKEIFKEVKVIIGLSEVVKDMSLLFSCIRQADLSVLNRVAEPGKSIIEYQNRRNNNITPSDIIDANFRNDFLSCMDIVDADGIAEMILQIMNKLLPFSYDGKLIYSCYLELVDIFLFGTKNYNIDYEFPDLVWFKRKYNTYMSLQDIFMGLQKEMSQIILTFKEKRKLADIKPIRTAKQYINDHYNTSISLESVSSHIGFNPAYFSSLFKKETGKNFMEYVMELRIQHAKQYLIQTDYTIDDVAREVGYSDLKYFSKLFKKLTGLNPSEFRKLYH